jgi:hypothetical protein
VRTATWIAQETLPQVHHDRERRHDVQRLLSHLHFIRSALIDRDAPLGAQARYVRQARRRRALRLRLS